MDDDLYPSDWPRCACGDFALDGKATCGRVECSPLPEMVISDRTGVPLLRIQPVTEAWYREQFCAPPPDDKTLVMYTIYERPKDFPEEYVARRWEVRAGALVPTRFYVHARTLDAVRAAIPEDKVRTVQGDVDPYVVETWI